MQTHVVIMAGGIGSRFGSMSTPQYPKQFIDVMGVGKSLIQLTVQRLKETCPMENFLHTLLPQDENGNATVGDSKVDLYNCHNCVVHVAESRQVVLEGLKNYIVAEKDGRLLVYRLSEEQRIKDFI